MKHLLTVTVLMFGIGAFGATAEAKGCIKGALIGGLAGHAAGHTFTGAAAGCAIGHHYANKKNAAQQNHPQPNAQPH